MKIRSQEIPSVGKIHKLFREKAIDSGFIVALYSLCYDLAVSDRVLCSKEKKILDYIKRIHAIKHRDSEDKAISTIKAASYKGCHQDAFRVLKELALAEDVLTEKKSALLYKCAKEWGIALTWREKLEHIVYGNVFRISVIIIILINAILIGIEVIYNEKWPLRLQNICTALFIIELTLKCIATGFRRFITNSWNIFDAIVTLPGLLPGATSVLTVLRTIRIIKIFQVFRIISENPDFRLIIEVMLRSLKAMVPLALLLCIFIYTYAILGMELFGKGINQFSTFKEAVFTLFRMLTLENWSDLRDKAVEMYGYWIPTVYFVSWIIIGAFMIFNLVIGIIVNKYDETKEENREQDPEEKERFFEELREFLREKEGEK
jgi:voltage-gated sodium channel